MSPENPDLALRMYEVFNGRDLGDITLLKVRGRAHGVASNTPLDEVFWQTIRWRDGMCIWWRNCPTEAEALEAIKLPYPSRDTRWACVFWSRPPTRTGA